MLNWKPKLLYAIYKANHSTLTDLLNNPKIRNKLIKKTKWKRLQSPLNEAVLYKRHWMLRQLLEAGVDPNVCRVDLKGNKSYPMHWAVKMNRIQDVEVLAMFGADEKLEGKYEGKKTHLVICDFLIKTFLFQMVGKAVL